jgi:hypothetical protein
LDCLSNAPVACTPAACVWGRARKAGDEGRGRSRTNTPEQWQQRARCGSIEGSWRRAVWPGAGGADPSSAYSGPSPGCRWLNASNLALQQRRGCAPAQKAIALPVSDTRAAVARRLAPSRVGVGEAGHMRGPMQPALGARTSAVARRLAPAGAGSGAAGEVRGLHEPAPAGFADGAAGVSPPAPGPPQNSC